MDNHESCDDIFSILEALENGSNYSNKTFEFQKLVFDSPFNGVLESETEVEAPYSSSSPGGGKRRKMSNVGPPLASNTEEGQPRASHVTVERNRRKQMNEHLAVLRSLMPCFYVKRGDQASIIGGVINYINEIQQVLHSLEAKKLRKTHTDVLSPRPVLSPRKPPLSPRTPQPSSPYKARLHNLQSTGFLSSPADLSPCNSSTSSINDSVNELVATSNSAMAKVEVKFCGPNLLLKTVSGRIPGQVVKIVSALEELELEILQVNINVVDEKMVNTFTIKIGIECPLSAEELAQQIQKTFPSN